MTEKESIAPVLSGLPVKGKLNKAPMSTIILIFTMHAKEYAKYRPQEICSYVPKDSRVKLPPVHN